jgi:2-iminobutanoate/2-iminopropanoate deaminase
MPHRYVVSGPDLPASPSPISQAVVAGQMCYVSGQLSTSVSGHFLSGTVAEEAERSFKNLFAALSASGFSPNDLVFVDVALTDLKDLPEVNELFARLFVEGRRPARTAFQAQALPYGGKVKIQGVAIRQS